MRPLSLLLPIGTLAGLLAFAACRGDAPPPAEALAANAPAAVVDSVLPMDVALDRFRYGLERTARLTHGAGTRDALVRRMMDAIEASDTLAFEALAVDRAEWAWLWFPESTLAKPPYELPPALAWFQLQEANRKGVTRALRELGGHALVTRGYRCADAPEIAGAARVWVQCTVTLTRDGGDEVTLKLFGSILERDGRFAFLSYANDF